MLGKLSLIVPTNGLMLALISWGIRYQRYDTYVGENIVHPSPQMYFVDPVGNVLMQLRKAYCKCTFPMLVGAIFDEFR